MKVNTKVFGEIEIADDRIISMDNGIIGFPDLKQFAIVHNSEREDASVAWFVSLDEPAFALPVINPLVVCTEYNPEVDDDLLKPLGEFDEDSMLVLVTMTIPQGRIEEMTVNLKAPIVINAKNRKGCQIILESEDYKIKYPIYDTLKKLKEESQAAAGE
ncbi:MAG: flagellar assembly protein FliW [Lachnospiraceae bacterium]|nr:flagellar assembly protein FliW [Lachnospiraceae bacterium]